MKKRNIKKLSILLIGAVLCLSAIAVLPSASADPDFLHNPITPLDEQIDTTKDSGRTSTNALIAGADYLVHAQADITEDNAGNGDNAIPGDEVPDDPDDGGWDWRLTDPAYTHSTSASPTNIYGATAQGLYYAYLETGDPSYFTALTDCANQLITDDTTYRTAADIIFLLNYQDLPGATANIYQNSAQAKYDGRITTYGSATALAEYIRDARHGQGYDNGIIAWDIGAWVVAAQMLDDRIGGYATDADDMAEVLYQDSFMDTPGYFDIDDESQGYDAGYANYDYYWYTLGITGLIDAFNAAQVHTSELPGLLTILLDCQCPSGSFSYQYGGTAGDVDWQSSAYAVLTLATYDQAMYQSEINDAILWIASTQDTASGGWVYGSGNHYPEIGGENTAALYFAAGIVENIDTSELFTTIQAAIDDTDTLDTHTLAVSAGTFPETVDFHGKQLTIQGAGIGNTIIDASGFSGYAVSNFGDHSTVRDVTLIGSNHYGFKVSHVSDITLENVRVENSGRTGVDLNTVNGATLTNIEVVDTVSGFGIMLLDCNNVDVTNIMTDNNPWGGVSVHAINANADTITFNGAFDANEDVPLLLEKDPPYLGDFINVDIPSKFNYVVYGLRVGDDYKQWFYQETLTDAKTLANTLMTSFTYSGMLIHDGADSFPDDPENYYVIPGMLIQDAIDDATAGDTIYIDPGNYNGGLMVDKSLTIIGSGKTQTIIDTSSSPVITVAADNVIIQNLGITDTPELVEGIRVVSPASSGLTVDNVAFTDIGAGTGANAYAIFISVSFSDLTVVDCDFTAAAHTTYYRTIGIFSPNHLNHNNFEISDSTFNAMWTSIYLRSAIDGLSVHNNVFGPVQSSDFAACVAGIYIGDGDDNNFDLENIEVYENTFTNYGRGVYVWNYGANSVIDNFNIHDNLFQNSVWSAGIRFIIGLNGMEDYYIDGITVDNNVFTQVSDVGANVAFIDFRAYDATLQNCNIEITNNDLTFSGSSYIDAMYGIQFIIGGDAFYNTLIENNIINGGGVGGAGTPPSTGINMLHYAGVGGYTWTHTLDMNILSNEITGFDHGISIFDVLNGIYGELSAGSTVVINCNEIYNNALYGIRNDNGETVDATCNWWGDCSGPTHANNPNGIGDEVTDYVTFDPFIGSITADAGGPYVAYYDNDYYVQFHSTGTTTPGCCDETITYLWDFGDGETSTEANPNHQYHRTTELSYTVTLTITTTTLGHSCSNTTTTIVTVDPSPDDSQPIIQLAYPEGGEILSGTVTVKWYAIDEDYPTGSINLPIYLYYRPLGSFDWQLIEGPLLNDGEYSWDTSRIADGQYEMLAEAVDEIHNAIAIDTSDPFTISGSGAGLQIDVGIQDKSIDNSNYVKDGDTIEITAAITGALASEITREDITADLSGFNQGTMVADTYNGFIAKWTITNVECTPENGPITVTVTVSDENTESETITADNTQPEATLEKPLNGLYFYNTRLLPLKNTIIFGPIDIQVTGTDNTGISKVEYRIDNELMYTDTESNYEWYMNQQLTGRHQLKITIYDDAGNTQELTQIIKIYNFFGE